MLRKTIKLFARTISYLLTMPLVIVSKVGTLLFKSESLFLACGQFVSLAPGKSGMYLRSAFYKLTLCEFNINTHINFGTIFSKSGTKLGKVPYIGCYTVIGYASIGDGVVISNKVSILSGRYQHNFDEPERGIFDKEGAYSCINIGEGVFIGEQSVIMANVGEKAIIGAGSVVVKDIPAYSVAVGNPAKVIKDRRSMVR